MFNSPERVTGPPPTALSSLVVQTQQDISGPVLQRRYFEFVRFFSPPSHRIPTAHPRGSAQIPGNRAQELLHVTV